MIVVSKYPKNRGIKLGEDRPELIQKKLAMTDKIARCAEIGLGRAFGIWVPWVTPEREPVAARALAEREALTAANTNAAFGGCPAGDPDGTATDRITSGRTRAEGGRGLSAMAGTL